MKHPAYEIFSNGMPCALVRRISKHGMAVAQAVLIGLSAAIATGQNEESAIDEEGAQVLTRGPVHEAFAGIVTYNPEPGVVVEMTPPELIEELPPESRPVGDNISWIPGYWGWDDERSDFLWISGTWRALPPGRQWTTGYWGPSEGGYQWTSGYWADSTVREITYLPKPPVTVEVGPNIAAPSRDHSWTPGSWRWNQERYAWRPGYWSEGRRDWEWIPANYVWTPRGYVFVDGYWDYNFERRGVLYAPVHIQSRYYSRPGYSYSPVVAIGLGAVIEHLFLRPNYQHYYFGDYYERRYRDNGYYSPYAYQSSRRGYDPVYSHRRWTHREDRDWERRYEASYDYRRDHESARPPRTWADQKRRRTDSVEYREQQHFIATSLDQMAERKDSPMRIEQVPAKERERLSDLRREVGKSRDQRRELERGGEKSGRDNNDRDNNKRDFKPSKVMLPESPIVGKSPDRFDEKLAPPKPQQSSIGGPEKERSERNDRPERGSDAGKNRPGIKDQPEGREIDPKKDQPSPRREAIPQTDRDPQPDRRTGKPDREESKRETREEPQAREPKRETRDEPQVREPKRETREEPQVRERQREIREQPRKSEEKPADKAREESRPRESGRREAEREPSGKKSEQNKEDSGQSNEKARKKERN